MLRSTGPWLVLGVVAACQALPSSVPLADTGGLAVAPEGALARNRVPIESDGTPASDDDEDERNADTIRVTAAPAVDAGAPEAGVVALESSEGGAGLAWAGEYFGFDRFVRSAGAQPDDVQTDDKAHTRVEEAAPGILAISLVSSADGSVLCTMRARASGTSATLEEGETCSGLGLGPPLDTSGSAKLDGETLSVDLDGHGEITSADGAVQIDLDYHFEGKRR